MKIAIWTHKLGEGGAERVLTALGSSFSHKRHEVCFYVHYKKGDYHPEISNNVEVKVLDNKFRGLGPLQKLMGFWNFMRAVSRDKPDIIFTTGYTFNAAAILIAKTARLKSPVIIRETSTPSNQLKSKKGFNRFGTWLALKFYPFADRIMVSCKAIEDDLKQVTPRTKGKCTIIPNPLDFDEINKHKSKNLPPTFPQNRPFIMGAGRLIPLKGFAELVQAWLELRKDIDIDLLILGEGPERNKLLNLVEERGAQKNFHLPGFDPNPYRYMARADLFVLSSHFEGMPNVLLQALACGCQVLSTDCPGASREILQDGAIGTLVPAGNSDALLEGIKTSLGEKKSKGVSQNLQKYDLSEVTDAYLQTFETALKESLK